MKILILFVTATIIFIFIFTSAVIPSLLLDKLYILPWTNLVYQEIKKIDKDSASNESEFLAVVSEYFFSQPKQLKQKHPELYGLLEKVFQQSPQQ
jgi:hypothetical protein